MNTEYNGWTNYETWSIALNLGNNETLYNLAKEFVQQSNERCSAEDPKAHCLGANLYDDFLDYADLANSTTPELVAWSLPCLDREALRETLIDLLEH